jgi:Fur family ferric uptake transcriptional regulator
VRQTKQRELILGIFGSSKEPISAPEIVTKAQERMPNLNKTTVYRTLERLEGEGIIERMLVNPNVLHYELKKKHHHHFVCRQCAGVFCIEGCAAGIAKLLPDGFQLEAHDITLHGLCNRCTK